MHKEQEEAEVGSGHGNKYLATKIQGKRVVIGGLIHKDRLSNGCDEGNH